MNYLKSMKEMEKIVKTVKARRPNLKGVHHKDNVIETTDSFRVMRVVVENMTFDEHVLDISTGESMDASGYAKIDTIYPMAYEGGTTFSVTKDQVKTLTATLRFLKGVGVKYMRVFGTKDKPLAFMPAYELKDKPSAITNLKVRYELTSNPSPHLEEGDEIHLIVNIAYLIDMMTAYDNLCTEDGVIRFRGMMEPMSIVSGDMTYLLSPMRHDRFARMGE